MDGEMRPLAAAKAGRLWFQLDRAVTGTVTVKGPDGKEHACQFLGGVE